RQRPAHTGPPKNPKASLALAPLSQIRRAFHLALQHKTRGHAGPALARPPRLGRRSPPDRRSEPRLPPRPLRHAPAAPWLSRLAPARHSPPLHTPRPRPPPQPAHDLI